MAVSDYAIPWNPPDLTSGLSLLARSLQARRAGRRADENAKTQRMFADAQLRRMDSETARQLAEHNAKQNEISRKMEMEKAAFMERVPYLTRNPLLPAIAAQYGIQGQMVDDPGQAAPSTAPSVAPTSNPLLAATGVDAVPTGPAPSDTTGYGYDTSAPREIVREYDPSYASPNPAVFGAEDRINARDAAWDASGGDKNDYYNYLPPDEHTTVAGTTLPSEPAPSRMVTLTEADVPPFTADELASPSPAQGQQAFTAADLATPAPAQAQQAAMPTPAQPATMQPTPSAPMPRNKLFRATVGGQTYDIGGQSPTTGLGEKYDALYDRYLQEPGGEKVAFAKTLAAWQAEQTSNAAGERARETAGSREHLAGQKEELTRWLWDTYHLTAEQLLEQRKLDRASREHAAASASGQAPVPPALAEIVRQYSSGELPGRGEALAAAADKKLPAKMVSGELGAVTRDAATAERASEKKAGLEVNDLTGKFVGYAHNTTQANKMKTQTDQFAQASVRLKEFLDDIEKDGPRISLLKGQELADAIQDRLSKAESVNAAMRVYNGLGATDASQQLEARITGAIGTPGHGWIMGSNLGVIRRILHEAEMQHNTRLMTTLRSGPSAQRQLAPVLGGPPRGEAAPAADVKWIRIPASRANDPNFRGKNEISVDAAGNITGVR